jgi:hypothetical protein
MRWAVHIVNMGERCIQGFDGKLEERDHLEDLM